MGSPPFFGVGMDDDTFEPIEPVRRGPGRPRKVETPADAPVVVSTAGVKVRTLKDIQMPREYLLDYAEGHDPKLRKGDLITMKPQWALLLITAGKVAPT